MVNGRVLDENGRPVPHTLVEVWQANAAGRYPHKTDQHNAPLDPNFSGAGRTITDAEGRYRFITIRPGEYPWRNHYNAWRPAHIHFSLFGQAFLTRMVTQMYFPGDALLPYDPMFNCIANEGARQRLIAAFDWENTIPEQALGYRFDIVLRGREETPMGPGRAPHPVRDGRQHGGRAAGQGRRVGRRRRVVAAVPRHRRPGRRPRGGRPQGPVPPAHPPHGQGRRIPLPRRHGPARAEAVTLDATVVAIFLAVAGAALGAGVWWITAQAAAGRSTPGSTGIHTRGTTASDEGWVRGHEVALPWTVAGRYAAGVVALATLAAVGAGNAAPWGILLGLATIGTVLITWFGAVAAINLPCRTDASYTHADTTPVTPSGPAQHPPQRDVVSACPRAAPPRPSRADRARPSSHDDAAALARTTVTAVRSVRRSARYDDHLVLVLVDHAPGSWDSTRSHATPWRSRRSRWPRVASTR